MIQMVKRGRPTKQNAEVEFDSSNIQLFRGSDLIFSDLLFEPMATGTELDVMEMLTKMTNI